MGFITVRLISNDPTEAGATALFNAREDIEHIGLARFPAAADSQAANTVIAAISGPTGAYAALGNVVSQLDIFIGIVDEVSKVNMLTASSKPILTICLQIHPYVNFAWQVTSSLYKVSSFRFLS